MLHLQRYLLHLHQPLNPLIGAHRRQRIASNAPKLAHGPAARRPFTRRHRGHELREFAFPDLAFAQQSLRDHRDGPAICE